LTTRAIIEPVPEGTERPRWSVMIPAYNCAAFLGETLRSVLAQAPGPERMQIEVVDDASTDHVKTVVEDVGKGRVDYFRQERNVGQVANFATCLQQSRGEIVHLLHGDDTVFPGFYDALDQGFGSDPGIGAAFCRWQTIDERGKVTAVAEAERETAGPLHDALARLASEQRIVTPSIAVRRSAYERLGGFDPRLDCAEDWEMWVRIAARFRVWYEPRLLASYRQHSSSTTAAHFRDASELRHTLSAIRLFKPLLPRERAQDITRSARRAYARTALGNAREFARKHDAAAMRAHLAMALRFQPSAPTLRDALRILLGLDR